MGADRGMTLIELILVMSLVGILAFVATPRFMEYREIELRTATRQVAADIRYAQSRAISTRVRHGVVFDPAAGQYTVYKGTPATPATDFMNPGEPMRRIFDGVTMTAAVFDATNSVEFNSMGVPYAGGNELAAIGFVVLVGGGGAVDSVRVSPLTGRVEL